MQKWPEHSLYGYLTRLPTYKLEQVLAEQSNCAAVFDLKPEDFTFIRQILQARPDSSFFLPTKPPDSL